MPDEVGQRAADIKITCAEQTMIAPLRDCHGIFSSHNQHTLHLHVILLVSKKPAWGTQSTAPIIAHFLTTLHINIRHSTTPDRRPCDVSPVPQRRPVHHIPISGGMPRLSPLRSSLGSRVLARNCTNESGALRPN